MTGPLPEPSETDRPYWEAAAAGVLRMQTCRACARKFFPPSRRCRHCGTAETDWTDLSGRGRIWSWVVFHRRYFPDMPPPYTVLRVQLDEGPLLCANLVDAAGRAPAIDTDVRVVFRDAGALLLPYFTFAEPDRNPDR
jgi:uncharacterized OB-fold protein